MRLRSRLGSCMTSPFNLLSAASPVTGLVPEAVGLSLALTHGARPWSGISRVTFPYMAAMSLLWRCSFSPLCEARRGSMRSESSAWLRRPGRHVSSATATGIGAAPTKQELRDGVLVRRPWFRANGGFEFGVDGLEVYPGGDDLAGLWDLLQRGTRDGDGFRREDRGRQADRRTAQVRGVDVRHRDRGGTTATRFGGGALRSAERLSRAHSNGGRRSCDHDPDVGLMVSHLARAESMILFAGRFRRSCARVGECRWNFCGDTTKQ